MIGQNLEEGTVPVYGWMVGDLDVAKEAARAELRAAGLSESVGHTRSEERRVGKECRSRWSPYH